MRRLGNAFLFIFFWLWPAGRLVTHHIPDADVGPPEVSPLPELTWSYRALSQDEALAPDNGPLRAPCTPPDPQHQWTRNEQNPLPGREHTSINLGVRLRPYFGTLHSHSGDSDGQGEPSEAFRVARDVAHLDFFALTDHSEFWLFGKEHHYDEQKRLASAAERPGFVTLYGFEYSNLLFGHYTVLNAPHVHHAFEDHNIQDFYSWLKLPAQASALVMFAHPGFHDYRFAAEFAHFAFDPALKAQFVGIEVIHWSEYLRYFRGFFGLIPYIDEATRQGWWLGASGSEDVHYANWGSRDPTRTVMLLPSLSHAELLSGLKARHFYATTNRNLHFALNVERRDHSWAMMGDQVNAAELPPGEVTVKARYYDGDCKEYPHRLEAVLDGNVVATYEVPPAPPSAPFPFAGEFTLRLPLRQDLLPSRFGFYVRFYQGEDRETFTETSPVIFQLGAMP